MKATFLFGLLLGFAATLAAAHYYPWIDHPRLPSQAMVQPNGGRIEQFIIRLPADRIVTQGVPEAGLRGRPYPENAPLPEGLSEAPLLLEHFKVRDLEGRVIGLAARHWLIAPEGAATAWILVFPSRGAMMLTAPGEDAGRLDTALAAAGLRPGSVWDGQLSVSTTAAGGGAIVWGSEEFAALTGSYTEAWELTGASASGELRGTVRLATVTYRSP